MRTEHITPYPSGPAKPLGVSVIVNLNKLIHPGEELQEFHSCEIPSLALIVALDLVHNHVIHCADGFQGDTDSFSIITAYLLSLRYSVYCLILSCFWR